MAASLQELPGSELLFFKDFIPWTESQTVPNSSSSQRPNYQHSLLQLLNMLWEPPPPAAKPEAEVLSTTVRTARRKPEGAAEMDDWAHLRTRVAQLDKKTTRSRLEERELQGLRKQLAVAKSEEVALEDIAVMEQDVCPHCGVGLRLDVVMSMHVCCSCGRALDYLDGSTTVLVFSEASYDFSGPMVRRSSHFDAWVASLQGKERVGVSGDVLAEIMAQLREDRVPVQQINVTTVQAALKKLKLRKLYDHVQVITSRLSGQAAPQLTLPQEQQIKLLFMAASNSFQRNTPATRRNMIAYSVVLRCICRLLGLDLFQDSFVAMKSKDKLAKQATYVRNICVDLGWDYNVLRSLFQQQDPSPASRKRPRER